MDLSTSYLGLNLKNPIISSAGPISESIDNIKRLEDAGAAAVVLYSLFEEEIEHDSMELYQRTTEHEESFAEAPSYFPEPYDFKIGPEEYLEHIRKAKESADIPVIASLNGNSPGGWIDYAKKIQYAGADALELNIYRLAADPKKSGPEVEKSYLDIMRDIKMNVDIPVAVKMHPFFSSVAWMAEQLIAQGADGLVLFNRFYQPDIDIEILDVVPNLFLSTEADNRLALRWIGILYGNVDGDLAAAGGIHNERDVLKMIMAGAQVTQMLSALLKNGIKHITDVLRKMVFWMETNEYDSLEMMRGSMSHKNVANPSQYERANYMKVLHSYKKS
ncbi:MAG TPA: dihydroorotate dehydrogenase-like protein [Ignavibacteriaceae bacterium]|nr:dihydroorotate dehydrogenase-like protein [Ignavibacteriaceae bacterium]